MRKQDDGLVANFQGEMLLYPFPSRLFVFCNNARTIIKLIVWDGNGFVRLVKRIEKTRFKWSRDLPPDSVQLIAQQVSWLLDGYDLTC